MVMAVCGWFDYMLDFFQLHTKKIGTIITIFVGNLARLWPGTI